MLAYRFRQRGILAVSDSFILLLAVGQLLLISLRSLSSCWWTVNIPDYPDLQTNWTDRLLTLAREELVLAARQVAVTAEKKDDAPLRTTESPVSNTLYYLVMIKRHKFNFFKESINNFLSHII
ncbi:unnamed protein product [Protopolystoma xenopodis]|uniref:Uncharacterized protein n=1 Tax=Protopolystoma xenopodis TaxID=117903 RepID=A0A448WHU9_9PLAT|nr:unnamed protein product [Protopolystoma xenopodis]